MVQISWRPSCQEAEQSVDGSLPKGFEIEATRPKVSSTLASLDAGEEARKDYSSIAEIAKGKGRASQHRNSQQHSEDPL